MAKGKGGARAPRGSSPRGRRATPGAPARTRAPARASTPSTPAGDPHAPHPADGIPRLFRLGAIPGATPGTWIDRWRERMPGVDLVLTPLSVAAQRTALLDGAVDAALVRLPIDRDALHVIVLYEETPVVVFAADSHLAAADELEAADLDGEVRIVPQDDVLPALVLPSTVAPSFAAPVDTGEAIATVATGVGIVVVPMSLARLHHRRDVAHRPLAGAEPSPVALAWPAERTTPDVEAFVGIVRGRSANSSRG
ncbi:LysR substrate-binding domain-containing protein [Microbacterium sp. HA-8]|uniref:LysR substrate-binding domain-containing protein n=1 Tax=Microbacterium sp. HA-8 TaxID=3234200 RepID=UPI0038F7FD85